MARRRANQRARRERIRRNRRRTEPPDRYLKASQDPFQWSLQQADFGGPWGFTDEVFRDRWCGTILPGLVALETKKWSEIATATSGMKGGSSNHHIQIEALSEQARERLPDTQMFDVDALYSLRLHEVQRLFGRVDNHVLFLLWYDPEHEVSLSGRS